MGTQAWRVVMTTLYGWPVASCVCSDWWETGLISEFPDSTDQSKVTAGHAACLVLGGHSPSLRSQVWLTDVGSRTWNTPTHPWQEKGGSQSWPRDHHGRVWGTRPRTGPSAPEEGAFAGLGDSEQGKSPCSLGGAGLLHLTLHLWGCSRRCLGWTSHVAPEGRGPCPGRNFVFLFSAFLVGNRAKERMCFATSPGLRYRHRSSFMNLAQRWPNTGRKKPESFQLISGT